MRDPNKISRELPTTSQETPLQESNLRVVPNPSEEVPREISCNPATEPRAIPCEATNSLQKSSHRTSPGASEADQDTPGNLSITISEAVGIIRGFSKQLHATPREIHIEIVRFVREGVEMQQSDIRTWKNIVRTSFFKTQKHKLFTLLEYIGATCWFDKQVLILQQSSRTKRGQPIDSKTASGRVLDDLWVEYNPDSENILCKMTKKERGRIWTLLYRGRELRNQVVKQLTLGVLFFPNIW
jgi:hypothetical protein